ncbi:YycC family protein [Paenibacillus dakarensis]|uniref:YycC family protein n=1 Tax=Paenibacillus dakarensis TaxID=1527293 RepID=UPI0006D54C86|nr:YycC family protein [Paenibacillus dakarensis]
MRPLQISPETAITLSKQLGVPIEQLMHMPQHILMQKIAALAETQQKDSSNDNEDKSQNNGSAEKL